MAASLIVVATLWATVAMAGVNEDLIEAAKSGDLHKVKRLIDQGAKVNAKDKDGSTALMLASQSGKLKVVKVLIGKGADVNAKNNNDISALMIVSQNGQSEIVKVLLAKGAGSMQSTRRARPR